MTAYYSTLDDRLLPRPASPARRRWSKFTERQLPVIVIYLMLATLVGVILAPYVIVTVPTGQVGVLWQRFHGGTVLNPRRLHEEGLRLILPWNKLFLYDLRLQSTTDTYNAISRDGVALTASINTRFRLKHDAVPQLHQSVGPDYIAALVRPEIGNRMREVIAEYTAEEVYSVKRPEIQERIRQRAEAMLGEKMMERDEESEGGDRYRIPLYAMLNLIDTLILGIELPPMVVAAINRKIEQYYISEEYVFRIEREKRESERKKIEGEGIRAFQQMVSEGISDSYLRWRGIEATLALAQSPNSKTVIVGSGRDGLPLILGNADGAPVAAPPPVQQGPGGQPEKTTATAVATPPEKTAPPEKTPPNAVEKTSVKPGAEAQRTFVPYSLSDIHDALARFFGSTQPTAPDTGATAGQSPK